MKFDDLRVEFIKTLMATQRIVLTPWGYAISFMGDEQGLFAGNGTDTFEVKVFKHNLELVHPIDFFGEYLEDNVIDFKHTLITLKNVSKEEIDDFFNSFMQ